MEEKVSNRLSQSEIIKLSAIIGVLLLIFIYSVFSKNNFERTTFAEMTNETLDELLEPIKDNYTLTVDRKSDENVQTIEYITDGTLKLYNEKGKENGYLVYKGKTYYVESKNTTIKVSKKNPEYMNDPLSDITFIKKITKYCDFKDVKKTSFNCNINMKDYIEEYNVYNNTSYTYDGEEQIQFHFTHEEIINNITVDYSTLNNIMGNNKNMIYSMNISNVSENDYSTLLEVFKNTLK